MRLRIEKTRSQDAELGDIAKTMRAATMYYYYVLLDGRGAGWRVVGNALRAVHVRVNFFLRHRFPWKFPETVFFRASQISERISGNLGQSQTVLVAVCLVVYRLCV